MNTKTILASVAVLGAILSSTSSPSLAWNRFDANHPRRAEVLGRTNNLNNRINNNRGNLNGHYGQLKHEDNKIRKQEQRMARNNGGYITHGQQAKLNREENHVNNQIKRDR
jgi:hypothetical protein